jgi:hypothetical protein
VGRAANRVTRGQCYLLILIEIAQFLIQLLEAAKLRAVQGSRMAISRINDLYFAACWSSPELALVVCISPPTNPLTASSFLHSPLGLNFKSKTGFTYPLTVFPFANKSSDETHSSKHSLSSRLHSGYQTPPFRIAYPSYTVITSAQFLLIISCRLLSRLSFVGATSRYTSPHLSLVVAPSRGAGDFCHHLANGHACTT